MKMKQDAEEFLKEILHISSVNGVDDERIMAACLRDFFKEYGISTVLQEIDSRRANVIAVLEGKSKESVVWNGHLDTVPYGKIGEWITDPSVPVKENGCIYARGASDMKSGLAGMAYALAHMKAKGHVPRHTIYFCGTCDEEKGGTGARHLLESRMLGTQNLMLIGEPTGLRPGVAQKGCIWIRLKVQGKTSHGAYPEEGANAIELGTQMIRSLKEILARYSHDILGKPTIQITMAKGGIVPNMTPDEAEFMLDIRVVPGITTVMVEEWLAEIIGQRQLNDERIKAGFAVENDRGAIEIPNDNIWLKKLKRELKHNGLCCDHRGISYFTDASVLNRDMPDVPVLLFGPGDPSLAHKPNEYVEVEKYLRYIQILTKLF